MPVVAYSQLACYGGRLVSRGRHPKNAINSVLGALPDGFEVVEIHRGHRWGVVRRLACGGTVRISSTPRTPEDEADAIARFVRKHLRAHEEDR
jgi:hypothetical protein